jgi:hemolysin III
MRTAAPRFFWDYDRGEIIADGVIHALGITFALAGGAILLIEAAQSGDGARFAAAGIYLAGLVAMLGFSAAYNLWPVSPLKWWLRRFDHAAIYLLIAATYTAFMLPMRDSAAAVLLAAIWLAALAGMTIKLLWPGRLDRAAVLLYLAMGWSGLLAMDSIGTALSEPTLALIIVGGALYSLGVVFHAWRSLRFQNAIWHAFVLAAAACHYAAVLTTLDAG